MFRWGFRRESGANKRPRRGRSEANQRSVCRGRRRRSAASEACRLRRDEGCGACADARPLCVVAEEGVTGEKPHRKGFSLVCPFGDFYDKGKVTRVRAGEARELSNRMAVTGEEKCFSPTRPAMGESQPIGAICWHRRNENGVRGRSPRQQKNLSSPLGTKGSPSAVPPAFAPEARAHAPVTEGLRPALTGRSRANQGTPSKAAFSRWPPLSGDGKLPIFPFLACSQLLLIP